MISLLLIIAAISVMASAYYAGFETGVYSLNEIRLAHRLDEGSFVARALIKMKQRPEPFIVTILIGNNVANYAASVSVTAFFDRITTWNSALLTTIVLTPIIFLFSEIIPKRVFQNYPYILCYNPLILIFYYLSRALYAVPALIIEFVVNALARLLGAKKTVFKLSVTRKRLLDVFQHGESKMPPMLGIMAVQLMENTRLPVSKLMLPISECVLAHVSTSLSDFIKLSMDSRRSRIPVYDVDRRKPIGLVDIFSTLKIQLKNMPPEPSLAEFLKPLMVVSHSTSCYSTLKQMQRQRESIAGVIDDSGNLIGLISITALAMRVALPAGAQTTQLISPESRLATRIMLKSQLLLPAPLKNAGESRRGTGISGRKPDRNI